MLTTDVDSNIYYTHTLEEIAELAAAIVPLMDSVAIVSTPGERHHMRRILAGKHFRLKHAKAVKNMLLRACKYTKLHLAEYFPLLHHDVLVNTQRLEDAVSAYWADFKRLRDETIAVS